MPLWSLDRSRPDGVRAAAVTRGWSRDGAIAAVLATHPPARLLRGSARVGLMVLGAVAIAVGVAVTLWTGLGPGPLDVFIGAVRVRAGVPLGVAIWIVVGLMIAAAWMLGRRPGPGTLLAPFVVGPVMQVAVDVLDSVPVPDALVARGAIHLVAVGAIGVGGGALIVSGLGAGSGELLAIAASDRTGRQEPRLRMAFESTWLVLGVVLGGPIGVGTVMVALAIGPAVVLGHRWVTRMTPRLASGPPLPVAAIAGRPAG